MCTWLLLKKKDIVEIFDLKTSLRKNGRQGENIAFLCFFMYSIPCHILLCDMYVRLSMFRFMTKTETKKGMNVRLIWYAHSFILQTWINTVVHPRIPTK